MSKKQYIIIAIVLVLAAIIFAGFAYYQQSQNKAKPGTTSKQIITSTPPSKVYTQEGVVKSISGTQYTLTANNSINVYNIPTSTPVLVRKVSSKGVISSVAGKISQIVVGSDIMLYASSPINSQTAKFNAVEIVK